MDVLKTAHLASSSARRLHLKVDGMSCAGCVAGVEKHLGRVTGVDSVSVNLALESATVTTMNPDLSVDDVIAGLSGTSYTGRSVDKGDDTSPDDARTFRMFLFGAVLTAPLMFTMLAGWLGFDSRLPPWFQFALALPVQVVLGARFYRGAWAALRERTATMDTLVAMGTTAAFVFSSYALTRPNHGLDLFFEASAIILTLVMLGKWLEVRARRAASDAIQKLMDLRPDIAVLLTDAGEREVAVDSLRPGDRVLVRPGARLPVDGVVTDGLSEIDESMVTGESVPQRRGAGDAVIAGSVNADGRLIVQATRVGEDSTLARIVELVRNAQTGKAPVQKLVDSISAIFVPVVILIAAVTFFGWMLAGGGIESAVMAAVSVVVIACPCALGLATPTALVAGSGAAAEAGILVRDIETLERAANISHVVFDKTGTLTEGSLAVGYFQTLDDDDSAMRQRLAVLQQSSEHPLARAIVKFADQPDTGLKLDGLEDFNYEPGEGVSARVDGVSMACGNELLMQRLGIDLEPVRHFLDAPELVGQSISIIAENGQVKGVLGFVDKLRTESADAVKRLSAAGVLSVLLSGDAPGPVSRIAQALGITNSHSRVLPGKKLAHVEELKSAGHTVAMVGDGVNDAPALAAAHVGIAMGGGTDVAMETAGVTLMRPDPGLVSAVIDIARRVRSGIRQNLFWAFIFNLIGVPLAVFGMCSPTVAGAAMAASSVLVVSNSLRLRHWKPELTETRV